MSVNKCSQETKTFEVLTSVHRLPVIKDSLREGLTGGGGTESSVETEGLRDGQVGLDREHGGANTLLLREDLSTTLIQT